MKIRAQACPALQQAGTEAPWGLPGKCDFLFLVLLSADDLDTKSTLKNLMSNLSKVEYY